MSNDLNSKSDRGKSLVYQIRIKGHLDSQWADWFEGLTITLEEDGDTLLTGTVVDQAALHGLLKKVRDLGMILVSVNRVQFDEAHPHGSKKGDQKMNTNIKDAEMKGRKVVLSTLWIFAMLNYIYADVYGLYFNPILQKEMWKEFLSGYAGTIQITQGFVLVTAILMETAIAMVLFSRLLKYRPNRWANILMGAFHTLFVSWSLIGETPSLFYGFFAAIEIVCTLFITWYAWTWRDSAARS